MGSISPQGTISSRFFFFSTTSLCLQKEREKKKLGFFCSFLLLLLLFKFVIVFCYLCFVGFLFFHSLICLVSLNQNTFFFFFITVSSLILDIFSFLSSYFPHSSSIINYRFPLFSSPLTPSPSSSTSSPPSTTSPSSPSV